MLHTFYPKNRFSESPKSLNVESINEKLLHFTTEWKTQGYEKLGPSFSQDLTLSEVSGKLMQTRMIGKYEKPVESQKELDKIRAETTIASMVNYDMEGISCFDPYSMDLAAYDRYNLFRIRDRFHEILAHYRFDVSGFEFPSGETFVSSGGNTDLYAKLKDIDQLTCTADCLDLFKTVAFKSPILKYAINRHFKNKCRKYKVKPNFKKRWTDLSEKYPNVNHRAYAIFCEKVDCVVTIVKDARVTTVPKNLETDRVIECEALCNMIVQRCIACCIKHLIRDEFGIDLDNSQVLHKLLLSDLNNVTIDLRNASNSVFLAVCEWFMSGSTKKSKLLTHLIAARCGTVVLPDGERYKLNMLSPMGNGFTFEVMTLILLVITRHFDTFSHVFGDDIIVDRDVADDVIRLLSIIGFHTNDSKTFLTGNFRESCGGFAYNGVYLTSFDFHWATNVVEAVVNINKVFVMSRNAHISNELRERLILLHVDLLELVPQHMLRGVEGGEDYARSQLVNQTLSAQKADNVMSKRYSCKQNGFTCLSYLSGPDYHLFNPIPGLEEGVWIERKTLVRIMHKETKIKRHKRVDSILVESRGTSFSRGELQLAGEKVDSYLRFYVENDCYRFKSGRKMKPIDNVNNLLAWTYLAKGRVAAPILRSTTVKNRWEITYIPRI